MSFHIWSLYFIDASSISENDTHKVSLIGSNGVDNIIKAAQNGSELWGNEKTTNDSLVGGEGADIFWYSQGQGNDTIYAYGANDIINLYGVNTLNASAYSIESDNGNTTVIKMNTNTLFIPAQIGVCNFIPHEKIGKTLIIFFGEHHFFTKDLPDFISRNFYRTRYFAEIHTKTAKHLLSKIQI